MNAGQILAKYITDLYFDPKIERSGQHEEDLVAAYLLEKKIEADFIHCNLPKIFGELAFKEALTWPEVENFAMSFIGNQLRTFVLEYEPFEGEQA